MHERRTQWYERAAGTLATVGIAALTACGGGGGSTGNATDSGTNKTYLAVEASDADGDTLHYQWRVTAGSIENRDANKTVWTMPNGPGLHFAYVTISDGKGGYVEQQYAVSSDALGTTVGPRLPVNHVSPTARPDFTDAPGFGARLRFTSGVNRSFADASGASGGLRKVYVPDVVVQVLDGANVVFSGLTDLSGEVTLPKLESGKAYSVLCASSQDALLRDCNPSVVAVSGSATVTAAQAPVPTGSNLQVFGHIALADGGICGIRNEFARLQSAATVQLALSDGTKLTSQKRVNRFGDYALAATVPVRGSLQLLVQCESFSKSVAIAPAKDANGGVADYTSASPIEVSYQITNSRPLVVKMVASGPEGNVRGEPVVIAGAGATSNSLPGAYQFLSYKGTDTRVSACMYYRALGAVGACDADGNLVNPISFDDWKRQRGFSPYKGANVEWAANYINRMDLNLVRRMVATKTSANDIAFYVCNHPGPDGTTQTEIDRVLDTALADQNRVACVAMEWTTSPQVNNGKPFTKFLTFGPDGSLLPSVNLDGRGEKFMPGACVACHGGLQYSGHFGVAGNPSPNIGSGFLAFDTGNYLFSTNNALTEGAQTEALYQLNQLVKETEVYNQKPGNLPSSTTLLIQRWYEGTGNVLNKAYVPDAWKQVPNTDEIQKAELGRLYREVVGSSCRTCHTSLPSPKFDWDSFPTSLLLPTVGSTPYTHVCGGTSDVALNASMPNALISRDKVGERLNAESDLSALMKKYLGCNAPLPDPVYPKR